MLLQRHSPPRRRERRGYAERLETSAQLKFFNHSSDRSISLTCQIDKRGASLSRGFYPSSPRKHRRRQGFPRRTKFCARAAHVLLSRWCGSKRAVSARFTGSPHGARQPHQFENASAPLAQKSETCKRGRSAYRLSPPDRRANATQREARLLPVRSRKPSR